MKTIFITLFQGTEAKSILRTNIFSNLSSDANVRIVFFVGSPERAEYYRKEFSHPRIVYESVAGYALHGWGKFFSSLSFKLLNTETVKLRRIMTLEENKNYPAYFFNTAANIFLAKNWIRKLVRLGDYFLVRENIFSVYFEKYQPALVFLANLFDGLEISLLREAKRRSVKTVGFINSWDKLTARNIIRVLPDKLLVFNDLVKQEAIKYADMVEKDIYVIGIPSYDWHINHKPLSREEFFVKKRLDPVKKLIVYAPMGKTFSNSDWDIIDLLQTAIKSGQIQRAQLMVRFQPNDFADELELKKRSWLIYDYPGIRFSKERGVDWDMSFDDIKGLTDTLANADVFVCYASSMSIDAAIFNKPVINIDFEVKRSELMSKSPTYFYQMTHYQNAVKSGGISYPKSKEEFINQINLYLENPTLDREGRQCLVREQCWQVDGKSGKRIANIILESIKL
ncbi:MAG: hypothetical protein HYV54_02400 [Parcubacteria group bacterium]|nr:hypothetical protein [Parcubacteria group bacterium]